MISGVRISAFFMIILLLAGQAPLRAGSGGTHFTVGALAGKYLSLPRHR